MIHPLHGQMLLDLLVVGQFLHRYDHGYRFGGHPAIVQE